MRRLTNDLESDSSDSVPRKVRRSVRQDVSSIESSSASSSEEVVKRKRKKKRPTAAVEQQPTKRRHYSLGVCHVDSSCNWFILPSMSRDHVLSVLRQHIHKVLQEMPGQRALESSLYALQNHFESGLERLTVPEKRRTPIVLSEVDSLLAMRKKELAPLTSELNQIEEHFNQVSTQLAAVVDELKELPWVDPVTSQQVPEEKEEMWMETVRFDYDLDLDAIWSAQLSRQSTSDPFSMSTRRHISLTQQIQQLCQNS